MSAENKIVWITDPDVDRYSTLRLIEWWDQQRLAAARVMVVGAGALGNEVIKNLALLGVGKIFVVDFDRIEASNLSRAVLFRPADRGQFKAEAAARRTVELNDEIEVTAVVGNVRTDVGLGLYRRMDVVIGCLDNREARMLVNRACWRAGRPWIDAGLDILDGLMRVFSPPEGACYECTMTKRDYELLDIRYSCPPGAELTAGRQPTTPTAASIIAAMQVQEAVKLIHGHPVVAGRGAYYSGASLRLKHVHYPLREGCPAHDTYNDIIELPSGSDVTVEAFLDSVGGTIMALDQEVLTYFACPSCQVTEAVFRPYYQAIGDLDCPKCRSRRLFDVTSTIGVSEHTAGLRLSRLGVPALHILPVRTREGWRYVELTGDAARLNLSGGGRGSMPGAPHDEEVRGG
jgi:molybdopterin/thiamine biosynthesis adenylyltransferase